MNTNNTAHGVKAPRTPMPCQDPSVRAHNFDEVALGYSDADAAVEASRCLQCKNPRCVKGCPVEVQIPVFIGKLCEGDIAGAYAAIKQTNALPAVCGRVCPQENQCEGSCILGAKGSPVAIGRLERYVADKAMKMGLGTAAAPKKINRKVACIGCGPSSITAAGYLASRGVDVTLFEALHEPGGVLIYGIPSFRLPKNIVAAELDGLRANGVEFRTNWVGGRTIAVQKLLDDGYDAVFIGVGAGLPQMLNIPGENAIGVMSANEYLTRVNLGRAFAFPAYDTPVFCGKHATIFGAGNVAMDAARTAMRLGAESVSIIYRRTRAEMPARAEEIEHALEEGVQIKELCAPVRFNEDENGRLTSVVLQRMELGEADASGRRRPVAIPGSEFEYQTDLAVIAVGTRSNPILIESTPGLELTPKGYIAADPETGETSIKNVFAGGDIVTGAATVILAMGAGRKAAREIAKRLGINE